MHCPICGSPRLSALAELITPGEAPPALRFGRLGMLVPRATFEIGYARACLDCGAVVPFLGDGVRRLLDGNVEAVEARDITRRYYDEETDAWVDY